MKFNIYSINKYGYAMYGNVFLIAYPVQMSTSRSRVLANAWYTLLPQARRFWLPNDSQDKKFPIYLPTAFSEGGSAGIGAGYSVTNWKATPEDG